MAMDTNLSIEWMKHCQQTLERMSETPELVVLLVTGLVLTDSLKEVIERACDLLIKIANKNPYLVSSRFFSFGLMHIVLQCVEPKPANLAAVSSQLNSESLDNFSVTQHRSKNHHPQGT
jgi:uncharacterized protein YlzI (FlbEa/FlbD family)